MTRKSCMDISCTEEAMSLEKAARKTERSHEENQERAYIAASRRADRSIEARVQSARMASEIHKKRTGKGFKITEHIVMKEEMYEEEDDDLPRSYRLLSASMQTSSPELNSRLDAFLSNKVAMSQMLARTNEEWRENEINRLFAASFPNVVPKSQQTSPTMPTQPKTQQCPEPFSPTTYSPPPITPLSYTWSPFSQTELNSLRNNPMHASVPWQPHPKASKRKSRSSTSGVKSRRTSSKSSNSSATSAKENKNKKRKSIADSPASAQTTPIQDTAISPQTPTEPLFPNGSAFTTELPPEARMMLNGVGADAVLDQTLANQEDNGAPNWLDPFNFFDSLALARTDQMTGIHGAFGTDSYGDEVDDSMSSKFAMPNTQSAIEGGVDWGNFINDSPWTNE